MGAGGGPASASDEGAAGHCSASPLGVTPGGQHGPARPGLRTRGPGTAKPRSVGACRYPTFSLSRKGDRVGHLGPFRSWTLRFKVPGGQGWGRSQEADRGLGMPEWGRDRTDGFWASPQHHTTRARGPAAGARSPRGLAALTCYDDFIAVQQKLPGLSVPQLDGLRSPPRQLQHGAKALWLLHHRKGRKPPMYLHLGEGVGCRMDV